MKLSIRRLGAAALVFVVCLSLAPVASAATASGDRVGVTFGERFGVRAKIAKILKKLKGLPNVWILEDQPGPPHPKP
jgi:hypothetical protein